MSVKSRLASYFAATRVPAIGGAGIDPRREGEAMASHYLHARRVRRMSPAAALAFARELPAAYVTGAEWYESSGGPCGSASREGGETARHCADVDAIGLRFVGEAEALASLRYNGWYNREAEDGETLAGAVWQLPAKRGVARLIYGYREKEANGKEMNPGSALLRTSDIVRANVRGLEDITDAPETRDAAIWADGMAERAAEDERDWNRDYQAGARAAERDAAALEARAELMPLLAELRAVRRGALAGTLPAVCAALRERVDSALEAIREAREARDKAWSDCPTYAEDGWRAGFMDTAAGGFVRAVALGYAKASDWRGKPEDNPCHA